MTDLYSTTSGFTFVDSQFGTAATATGIKVNVPIITDLKYHKKVQVKTWWKQKGMIGDDVFSEGGPTETAPGLPVIRKTDFQGKRGDTIKMHQRTNLAITNNVGKVGNSQIVNYEVGWDMNYKLVKIEQWRQAVLTVGAMNEQRNPVNESFEQTEIDLLSDWTAQVQDTGLLYALHCGFSPHLIRQYDVTNLVAAANANTIFGNDQTLDTTRTIASLTGAGDDDPKAITFELGEQYCKENFFDPVVSDGDSYFVALMTGKALAKLKRDSEFRSALYYARERGLSNPLFKTGNPLIYSNIAIFEYEKIRTVIAGLNPAGITVTTAGTATSALVEANYTGIGGGLTAAKLTHIYFLGANALALAEGRMRMGDRKEDDYGQFIGRDADNIWGASRMDWKDATGAAANNQSSVDFVLSLT